MTSIADVNALMERHWNQLRERTNVRQLGEWVEITTPYLDRHNDCLLIYARRDEDGWELTDSGDSIDDLELVGCDVSSDRWRTTLNESLAGLNVEMDGNSLTVKATDDDFASRKLDLVQAMLTLNGMSHAIQRDVGLEAHPPERGGSRLESLGEHGDPQRPQGLGR